MPAGPERCTARAASRKTGEAGRAPNTAPNTTQTRFKPSRSSAGVSSQGRCLRKKVFETRFVPSFLLGESGCLAACPRKTVLAHKLKPAFFWILANYRLFFARKSVCLLEAIPQNFACFTNHISGCLSREQAGRRPFRHIDGDCPGGMPAGACLGTYCLSRVQGSGIWPNLPLRTRTFKSMSAKEQGSGKNLRAS